MEKKHIISVIYGIALLALFVTLVSMLGDAMNWDSRISIAGSVGSENSLDIIALQEYRIFGFGIGALILCVAFLLTKKWKYVHLGLGTLSLIALIISFSFILHYGIDTQYELGYCKYNIFGDVDWFISNTNFVVLTAFRASLYPILAELLVLFGIGIGAFVSPVRAVIADLRARKRAAAAPVTDGIESLSVEGKDDSDEQAILPANTVDTETK